MDKKKVKNSVDNISERLLLALDIVGYSAYRVAKEVDGITQQTFVNIRSGRNAPSTKVIAVFLKKFPAINGHWLITGEGLPTIEATINDNNKKQPYAQLLHKIPVDEIIAYIRENEQTRGFHKSDVYNLFLEIRTQKKLIEKMNNLENKVQELSETNVRKTNKEP